MFTQQDIATAMQKMELPEQIATIQASLPIERRQTVAELHRLDEIAREAWNGKYDRVGVLSTGEQLNAAIASGRMHELAPGDSIAYAVDRVGTEWMAHMLEVWRAMPQPQN